IDAGGSIAASGLAHALVHGGDMSVTGAENWITTSLMIAASKFVHERTTGMQHRITEAAQHYKMASADALLGRVTALNARSAKPAHTAEEGIAQLSERHALLIEERRLSQEANATRELRANSSDLAATGADFADVPLQLAHLSPVVE